MLMELIIYHLVVDNGEQTLDSPPPLLYDILPPLPPLFTIYCLISPHLLIKVQSIDIK
jgi:hypothetical protein